MYKAHSGAATLSAHNPAIGRPVPFTPGSWILKRYPDCSTETETKPHLQPSASMASTLLMWNMPIKISYRPLLVHTLDTHLIPTHVLRLEPSLTKHYPGPGAC